MGSGFGSDVSMSQCSPGESIDTTSFGQHDRQTNLGRTFCAVCSWNPEEICRAQKHTKKEETNKNKNQKKNKKNQSTITIKFKIDRRKACILCYHFTLST